MNKVILMGRLARDPDVRTTQSGKSVARMTIAVDRRMSRNAADSGQATTDFLNLVAWERLAEFAGNYLHKGSKILVEGRLQSRSYEAQDGSKRYVTEVNVSDIEFCESKSHTEGGDFDAPAPMDGPAPAASPVGGFGGPVKDDDIPF